MKIRCSGDYIYWLFAAIVCLGAVSCSNTLPKFGVGGRYEEGKDQFYRGRGGDMDKAVVSLEYVVSQDPTYKNSLTYLGRAYYRKERYKDAYVILQRAVVVNKDDEIAWLALGVTELRLGQNEKGIETLKGGITLASKVLVKGTTTMTDGISGEPSGHPSGAPAFYLTKGVEEKENIIQWTRSVCSLKSTTRKTPKRTTTHRTCDSFTALEPPLSGFVSVSAVLSGGNRFTSESLAANAYLGLPSGAIARLIPSRLLPGWIRFLVPYGFLTIRYPRSVFASRGLCRDHRQVVLNRPAYVPVRVPELSNGISLGLINIIQKAVDAAHPALDFFQAALSIAFAGQS